MTTWTETDIARLERAIKFGALKVKFSDHEVTYHSVNDMLKLLQTMKETVTAQTSSLPRRTTYGRFRKGPNG